MKEILFSDSAAGALLAARRACKEDILSFDLALSVGDIRESGVGAGRLAALSRLMGCYPEGQDIVAAFLTAARRNLSVAQASADAGEALRVWSSLLADDVCGLCWLCAQLPPNAAISLVFLPLWAETEKQAVRYQGWQEVAPDEFGRFLSLERPLSAPLLRACAGRWQELQKENGPLRALVNGALLSVPESFYDPLLLRQLERQEPVFQEARLIGQILAASQAGLSDGWLALRIDALVQSGALRVESEAAPDAPRYHRLLRKTAPCFEHPI